jgi:signal transduction histidine kinase
MDRKSLLDRWLEHCGLRSKTKNVAQNGAINGNDLSSAGKPRLTILRGKIIAVLKRSKEITKSVALRLGGGLVAMLARFEKWAWFRKLELRTKPFSDRIKLAGHQMRVWFNASFRNKVLVPVIGCTALVLVVTHIVFSYQLARQADKEARQTLNTANAVIRYSQAYRRNDLLLRFHNLPNVPLWNQLFQSGAPRDLHNTLRSLMEMQRVDIVFYMSGRGKILDVVNNPMVPPLEFEDAAAPVAQHALRGEEKVDTVSVAGKLYDVVAVPAYDSDNKQIGAVGIGSELGDAAAREFSKLTQGQVVLIANGRVIASTLPGLESNGQFANVLKAMMRPGEDATEKMRPILANGGHYYCITGRFESLAGDQGLGYVLLSSRDQSLLDKRMAQEILAVISLLAVLFGAMAVWYFVDKVTEPLRKLREGAEAVGLGDFNCRVPVTGQDECGQLALVFNQMTENLQQSRSQLEKTVETLKNTQEQLVQSEKLSAIGEFVAGVAHELNNPLTAVVGFSEMLEREITDQRHQHYSDRIIKAALRCKKIVQSLLSFSRRDKPRREPVSVNHIIESVLDIVGYSLRTSNIQLVTQLDAHIPMVLAESHQIQQAIFNIITNAQQAIENHNRQGSIRIVTETHLPWVRIVIEDSGPGIEPENLSRIFDPFFTTKDVGKGTGLGLSLCYGFIKDHGGSIRAVSPPGKGATFIIELPAVEKVAAVSVGSLKAKKPAPANAKRKRILIIDDEESILTLIHDDLVSKGYDVEVTTDGEQALRDLVENRFDMAVCDWKMPGLNGQEIYQQLQESNPKICERMIFMTGDVVNPQIRRFLEDEKRPCLSKPFALPELQSAVENMLTRG